MTQIKISNFFINQFDFESNDLYFNSKIKNNILGKLKNINYEDKKYKICIKKILLMNYLELLVYYQKWKSSKD